MVSLTSTILAASCAVSDQPPKQVAQATSANQLTPDEADKYRRLTSYLKSGRTEQVALKPVTAGELFAGRPREPDGTVKYAVSFPSECEMEYNIKNYSQRGPYYGGFTKDTTWHGGIGLTSDKTYKVPLASVRVIGHRYLYAPDPRRVSIAGSYREWRYPLMDIYYQRGYWEEREVSEARFQYTEKPDAMVEQTLNDLIELCRKRSAPLATEIQMTHLAAMPAVVYPGERVAITATYKVLSSYPQAEVYITETWEFSARGRLPQAISKDVPVWPGTRQAESNIPIPLDASAGDYHISLEVSGRGGVRDKRTTVLTILPSGRRADG